MDKDFLINSVINEMVPILNDNQIFQLKNVLIKTFYNVDVSAKETNVMIKSGENEEVLKKYAIAKKVEQLSDKTIYQYVHATKKFLDASNKNFKEITSDDIRYYFAVLIQYSKNSPSSLNNTRKFINSFFSWCYENDYINRNPFCKIKPFKTIEKTKEILHKEEINKLLNSCKKEQEKVLIQFLSDTGVRVSECVGIRIEAVNWEQGEVNIYSKKTRSFRTVYISDSTVNSLKSYLGHKGIKNPEKSSGFLFSRKDVLIPLKEYSVEKILQRLALGADIKKHCTVHIFRRTLATRLYRNGMPVEKISQILGHKNTSTTLKYYLVINTSDIKKEYFRCTCENIA